MKAKTYLTEQGVALNSLKMKILNNVYDDETINVLTKAFDSNVSSKLIDNSISLENFDIYIRTLKKYILSDEDVKKIEINKIIQMYDDPIMEHGFNRFLLEYNEREDIIKIKRMLKINVKYYENFFGVEGIVPKKDKTIMGRYPDKEKLNNFYNTFVVTKLRQVATAIQEECYGAKGFIKPNSKGLELLNYFDEKTGLMNVYLYVDRKSLKSIAGHINKMEKFISICDEVENKYLQPEIYSSK